MMNYYKFIFIVLFLLTLSNHTLLSQDFLLGPDDVLAVNVYREPELGQITRISSEGTISLPLIGMVHVEGLTVMQLEKALTSKLSEFLVDPQVTVFIKEYTTITVTGQVKKPGSYSLEGELTVIEAISLAGGFTEYASQNNVKIMRIENGKKKTIRVKVKSISRKGDKLQDIHLQRGDIVFVPESLF